MIVSESRKFIFAHVPKTGGVSIRAALESFADGQSATRRDTTHETLPDFLARHPGMKSHFKFAFVRNPWDRLVSFYFFARDVLARSIPEIRSVDGLGGMLRALESDAPWIRDLHIMRPQRDYLRGADGENAADFVGRFERLPADFAAICQRTGVEADLGRRNAFAHPPYTQCYDDWSRGFVAARYRADIQEFDYAFEAAA
jgi:chondroitin 4-sulfotransferase 11